MPRATSAACEALPPSEVRIPFAAWKPATSSASVNGRTRITARPSSAAATASGAVKTISPLAAPGEAATPTAMESKRASGANVGCSSASSAPASIVAIASAVVISPSSTASTTKRTAAWAGRTALRVCSMYRRPSSIGELGVLHVLVVALQVAQDLLQLVVDGGHPVAELGEVERRAHAGHDVLALGVR